MRLNESEGMVGSCSPGSPRGGAVGGWWAATAVATAAFICSQGSLSAQSPRVVLTPAPGHAITWDGNNGGYSTPDSPAAAPDNDALATHGAVAFGSSEFGHGVHFVANVNDGLYGNTHSWISAFDGTDDLNPFIGVAFSGSLSITNIAWSRDNGDVTGDCCGGTLVDRVVGVYTLQYTQVGSPGVDTAETGDAATGWANLGTVEYKAGADSGTFTAALRHRFDVSAGGQPLTATAIRIRVSDRGMDLDELEVNTPTEPVPPLSNFLVITPATGFQIDWDGNDGKLSDPSTPALVPVNRASVSAGTHAFASSELNLGVHFAKNVNDGLYGNAHSWISANGIGAHTDPDPFVGLDFGGLVEVKRIAWSRDNGDVAGDCCGGTLTDRAIGTYTLQITRATKVGADTPETGDAATGWQTVGTFDYKAAGDPFNPSLRHRYELGLVTGGGIPATGLRIKVSDGTMDIDEIEVNPHLAAEQDLSTDLVLAPQGDYSITWDGNDGDFNNPQAGARAPANEGLASRGSSAFGSSELNFGIHFIKNINDGFYGNSSSWISDRGVGGGADPDPYIGISFHRTVNITSLAWSRDNGDTTEGGCGGTCTDRALGTYTLQVTQVPDAGVDTQDTGDASTGWETVGTVQYAAAAAPAFNPSLRHEFGVAKAGQPIAATAVRIKVSSGSMDLDELEVNPTTTVTGPPVTDLLTITPADGFGISWDRNDGDFSSPAAGAAAPKNAGLATQGATAFASSELNLGVHFAKNINDGLYGNSHSWIPDFLAIPDPNPYCGIRLAGLTSIRSIAWGRDNGDATEAACGGTCTDRALGLYTLQFTLVPGADASTPETGDAGTGWQSIGTINYKAAYVGTFTPYLRHRFDVTRNGSPLVASAIRVKVPNNQSDIDELEINPYPAADENILVMRPETGFGIEWDGNNGDFHTDASPAPVPDNDALSSHGSVAFGTSELDLGVHFLRNLNDGLYGNAHSWIPDFLANPDPAPAAGIAFAQAVDVRTIAWGRDNGDVAGDCCGGTLTDRAAGTYTLFYTEVTAPDNSTTETGDASTGWVKIGTVVYRGAGSAAFRHSLRHEFRVSLDGAPIHATGIRIAISSNQMDMDEIEVNTVPPVPAPVASISPGTGEVVIAWRGGGRLFVAAHPEGPWTEVQNATNPFHQAVAAGTTQFFRIQE